MDILWYETNRGLLYYCLREIFHGVQDAFLVPAKKLQTFQFLPCEIPKICCLAAETSLAADHFHLKRDRHDLDFPAIWVDNKHVWMAVDADKPLHADVQA